MNVQKFSARVCWRPVSVVIWVVRITSSPQEGKQDIYGDLVGVDLSQRFDLNLYSCDLIRSDIFIVGFNLCADVSPSLCSFRPFAALMNSVRRCDGTGSCCRCRWWANQGGNLFKRLTSIAPVWMSWHESKDCSQSRNTISWGPTSVLKLQALRSKLLLVQTQLALDKGEFYSSAVNTPWSNHPTLQNFKPRTFID